MSKFNLRVFANYYLLRKNSTLNDKKCNRKREYEIVEEIVLARP